MWPTSLAQHVFGWTELKNACPKRYMDCPDLFLQFGPMSQTKLNRPDLTALLLKVTI